MSLGSKLSRTGRITTKITKHDFGIKKLGGDTYSLIEETLTSATGRIIQLEKRHLKEYTISVKAMYFECLITGAGV